MSVSVSATPLYLHIVFVCLNVPTVQLSSYHKDKCLWTEVHVSIFTL
jgi:hypothetical protein